MLLDHAIPCYLRFGRFQVRVKYEGQPKTCRRCGSDEHLNKEYRNLICFNCDQIGHESRDCPEDMLCCICKESSHMAIAHTRGIADLNTLIAVLRLMTPLLSPKLRMLVSPPLYLKRIPPLLLLLLPLLPKRLMSLQLPPLLLTAFLIPKAS